jgi:hypothetical protein
MVSVIASKDVNPTIITMGQTKENIMANTITLQELYINELNALIKEKRGYIEECARCIANDRGNIIDHETDINEAIDLLNKIEVTQ